MNQYKLEIDQEILIEWTTLTFPIFILLAIFGLYFYHCHCHYNKQNYEHTHYIENYIDYEYLH